VAPRKIVDMQAVCRILNQRGIPAYVEHTGGGTATIYAGGTYTDPYGDQRYQALAGPGMFTLGGAGATADLADFYIGPDDDGESEMNPEGAEPTCDRVTMPAAGSAAEQVADLIAKQVAASRYQPGDVVPPA
jgi:hypothetical protein